MYNCVYKYRNNKFKHRIVSEPFLYQLQATSPSAEMPSHQKEETGYLAVGVFTALQALPVKNAIVTVYDFLEDGTEHIHAHLITDENGRVPDIELPVYHDLSRLYGSTEYYFTTYNLRVLAENFYPVNVLNFRIYPGIKTNYRINLLPVIHGETTYTPQQTIITPDCPLDRSNY